MPGKLIEFCKMISGCETPVKDRMFMDISFLAGFNWRKKDIVAFRQGIVDWQNVNGEFFTIETKDNKLFSYKITEKFQGLLVAELKKHFGKS